MDVFDAHDRDFIIFVIGNRIDWEDHLSAAEMETLHTHGHEIASHTYSHYPVLIRNTAFTVGYTGAASSCHFEIVDDTLRTLLDGITIDLDCDLSDSSVQYLHQLVDSIDGRSDYDCVLDYYPCELEYCQSIYLKEIVSSDIKAAPVQVLTSMGSDSLAMTTEVFGSKAFLESTLTDTSYRCETFAYPRHAHDQREMNALMEAGYLAGRNGPISGDPPSVVPATGSYLNRVHTYQVPLTWQRPPNDSSEAWCRQFIRERIAYWKANGQWANLYAHTLAEWDSAHAEWALDEIVSDGGVWVAPFGDIARYVRQYHVTVDNPVEGWNDSLTVSAPLHDLPAGPWVHVVVTAFDTGYVESGWSNEVAFRAVDIATGAGDGSAPAPSPVRTGPPRPNPMNPTTSIPFQIDRAGPVTAAVYDVRGRMTALLIDGRLPAGRHEAVWDGTDRKGRPARSGVYFCVVRTAAGSGTEKVVLVR